MRLYNIRGKLQSRKVSKYLINWDAKSRSKLQFGAKQFLKTVWKNHVVYEEFPVYGSRMKVDILNATKKIAVEVQGRQHNEYNEFFHKNRQNYLLSIKRDVQKRLWLEKNQFILIELQREDMKSLSTDFIKEVFGINII